MADSLFARLSTAGGGAVINSSDCVDRLQLSILLVALRKQGHAISADVTREAGESGEGKMTIIHFLTCGECAKKMPQIVRS